MKLLKWIKQIIKFFSTKKKTTIFIKGNNIHKEKDVMNIETKSGDIKIENYHRGYSQSIVVLLIVFVVVLIAMLVAANMDRKNSVEKNTNTTSLDEEISFENKYVYGNYDGLIRHDNDTTSFQKCDSEFYVSTDERKKKIIFGYWYIHQCPFFQMHKIMNQKMINGAIYRMHMNPFVFIYVRIMIVNQNKECRINGNI